MAGEDLLPGTPKLGIRNTRGLLTASYGRRDTVLVYDLPDWGIQVALAHLVWAVILSSISVSKQNEPRAISVFLVSGWACGEHHGHVQTVGSIPCSRQLQGQHSFDRERAVKIVMDIIATGSTGQQGWASLCQGHVQFSPANVGWFVGLQHPLYEIQTKRTFFLHRR